MGASKSVFCLIGNDDGDPINSADGQSTNLNGQNTSEKKKLIQKSKKAKNTQKMPLQIEDDVNDNFIPHIDNYNIQPPQPSPSASITPNNNDDDDDDDDKDNNNPDYDPVAFKIMEQEVIILSTRNANLEQQIDELKKKLSSTNDNPVSANELDDLNGSTFVPVSFICDELSIDLGKLSSSVEIEHLEQLIAQIEPDINFNGKQLTFIDIVSQELDDNVYGLLNILVNNKDTFQFFFRCMIMEMLTYIYRESQYVDDDDQSDQTDLSHDSDNDNNMANQINKRKYNDNNQKITYDINIVYEICNHLKISKATVNEIDETVKHHIEAEDKAENIFIQ